jgi:AcrR family transcriptional regulator
MPPTRRERLRAATIDEIKQAALDQIAAGGAATLTIRGVARAIGMSPAGLYRYYDGLDDLITDLLTDAYNALADGVVAATTGDGSPRRRLAAGMLAYRAWCVAHPNRFLLLFGTPIPGYAAPEGGPTVEANRRIGEAFFAVVAEAWAAGEVAVPPAKRPLEAGEVELAAQVADRAPGFPADLVGVVLSTWAHFHGMVTLEILHQYDWIYPDPGVFYAAEVERILDGLLAGR